MPNILIVEDDIIIADGLDRIIRSIKTGINTTITGYAGEALKLATENKYDLFLLDIQLLDYSGFELAKELRDLKEYILTPIIFVTAIPTKELLAFKETHCYDYIIKPFKEEEVIEAVSTIINYGIKEEKEEAYIRIKQKGIITRINLKDIIYIESDVKKTIIITRIKEITLTNHPLYKLLEELSEDFVRCHRGYIINKRFIRNIDLTNNYIELEISDTKLPIGRKYKNLLKEC